MKNYVIGNAEYTVEFSTEASLHKELTDIIVTELSNSDGSKSIAELLADNKDVTQTTLHMFHAGLLKHQNNWDMSKTSAVIKQYFNDDKERTYKALREELIAVMETDGFFDLVG